MKKLTIDGDIEEFIQLLEKWHKHQTEQLKALINNKNADIDIEGDRIKADSEMAKGIRFGITLSLHMLGSLPFEISTNKTGNNILN